MKTGMRITRTWDLRRRSLIGLIISILSTILIAFSSYPWVGFLAACSIACIVGIGLWEYIKLAQAKNFHPNARLMIAVGVIEVFAFYLAHKHLVLLQLPIIILFIAIIFFFLAHFHHTYKALVQIAIELFGILYIAIPLSCMLGILYLDPVQDGRWWLMYLIAVTKITDVAGYFVGRLWGKKKLAPLLSPKKTVEGAIAGFVSAVLMSLFLASFGSRWMHGFDLPIWQAIWLGAAIGLLSQIGDLSESLLKRDAVVKDSNKLPGLGGILDIMDSLLFTTPIVYFYTQVSFIG
jgi:phosphatidate cytidylyltransferase